MVIEDISTRQLALALMQDDQPEFYSFNTILYPGTRVTYWSSTRVRAEYESRIKKIELEEMTRMSLDKIGTDRLKKVIIEGPAPYYHCFVINNNRHQEVVATTYYEICDELRRRDRQGSLDSLSYLSVETLNTIANNYGAPIVIHQDDVDTIKVTQADLTQELESRATSKYKIVYEGVNGIMRSLDYPDEYTLAAAQNILAKIDDARYSFERIVK